MAERFRYDEPGTLSRPGPIGRVTRFILGALCVYVVLAMLSHDAFADVVVGGGQRSLGMPRFTDLGEAELRAVQHYIRSRAQM